MSKHLWTLSSTGSQVPPSNSSCSYRQDRAGKTLDRKGETLSYAIWTVLLTSTPHHPPPSNPLCDIRAFGWSCCSVLPAAGRPDSPVCNSQSKVCSARIHLSFSFKKVSKARVARAKHRQRGDLRKARVQPLLMPGSGPWGTAADGGTEREGSAQLCSSGTCTPSSNL